MKLLFDTSVWVEHLRHAVLTDIIGKLRGRFVLGMDVVVASELRAGCRSKAERNVVGKMLAPYEAAGRLLCPSSSDFERAALTLSRLRERGRYPSGAKGALLDGLIATIAVREGALLVTHNVSDFAALAKALPLRFEGFEDFRRRL
jgi:predicted nucleic acid-binding protein